MKMMSFLFFLGLFSIRVGAQGGILQVKNKFQDLPFSIEALIDHDELRHGTKKSFGDVILGAVNIDLRGRWNDGVAGLYFTMLKVGTPPVVYKFQVDTGSDIPWIACSICKNCSTLSQVNYGDFSNNTGYVISDMVQYDAITGNLQTSVTSSRLVLGCGIDPKGRLLKDSKDGILGFGRSNSSFFSQIAKSSNVNSAFAHCLDGIHDGGTFILGNVVEPQVRTIALLPDKLYYKVKMTKILVGRREIEIDTNIDTIIDSGTTLAYFPHDIRRLLLLAILEEHGPLPLLEGRVLWFKYNKSLDAFPSVSLQFKGLEFRVNARDYVRPHKDGYTFTWRSSAFIAIPPNTILLGGTALGNKLVIYDLTEETIGWTEHDCHTAFKVQDGDSAYTVQAEKNVSVQTEVDISSTVTVPGTVTEVIMLLSFTALALICCTLRPWYRRRRRTVGVQQR